MLVLCHFNDLLRLNVNARDIILVLPRDLKPPKSHGLTIGN